MQRSKSKCNDSKVSVTIQNRSNPKVQLQKFFINTDWKTSRLSIMIQSNPKQCLGMYCNCDDTWNSYNTCMGHRVTRGSGKSVFIRTDPNLPILYLQGGLPPINMSQFRGELPHGRKNNKTYNRIFCHSIAFATDSAFWLSARVSKVVADHDDLLTQSRYIQRVLALCYFWDLEKIRISEKSHQQNFYFMYAVTK